MPAPGQTIICKWKDDKTAAFSVGGDDSLRSQLFFAIPEMDRHGLHGTWWVNPGRGGSKNYKNEDDIWANCWIACYEDWKAAAARGHDFANHTMHHLGAQTYAEAESEIRQTAEAIWAANPRQRLQLFDRGGGTSWGISDQELERILRKYDCVWGRGGGIEDPTWEVNPSAARLRGYVDSAIHEGSWHHVAFHGIGPACEWGGPVDGEAFVALLDYLGEKREQVWCGTHTEVHKYEQERSRAAVQVVEASASTIRLKLTTARESRLYDFPLTLKTRIPREWRNAVVRQGSNSTRYSNSENWVCFNAIPGGSEILIQGL